MKINLIVRKAKISDSNFILKLRNEAVTRSMSINKDIINKQRHNQWFIKNLLSNSSKIYVGLLKNKKIGVINFQKSKNKKIEVSINIEKLYRKKGLSTIFLNKAIQNIENNNFYTKVLVAKVKKENISSIRLFIKSGFKKIKKNKKLIFFQKIKATKSNSSSKHDSIIKNIEKIRSKNNVNWMNLLKIVFKIAPSEGRKIVKNINMNDKKISFLVQKLSK